ncbi:MAG: PrsW family glutamic-type intramembrane protease [Trebonia sp.]
MMYAAMVGLGFAMMENVGYYINALVTPMQGGVALLGYTFVLHGVWNGLAVYGAAGMAAGYALMCCVLAALLTVLVRDRRRVIGLIRTYRPAYVAAGLVSAGDIRMLASLRARQRARTRAAARGGLPAGIAMGDYQLAATELALLHEKARVGLVDQEAFGRRQRDLMGLMRIARDSLPPR